MPTYPSKGADKIISPMDIVDSTENNRSPFFTNDDSLKKISFRMPSVLEITSYDLLDSITDVAGYILLICPNSAFLATTEVMRVWLANDL